MLTVLFRDFLATSLSLVPVIVLMLLAAPFLRGRYSPQLRHLLWLAVVVRMLLPVSLQDAARFVIPTGRPVLYLEDDSAAVIRAFGEAQQLLAPSAIPASGVGVSTTISWIGVLAMLWIAGAAAYLAIHLAGYLLQCRKLRRWGSPATDPQIIRAVEELREELRIKKEIAVLVCGRTGPLLTGVFRPKIVLPEETGPGKHLYSVLRHELTHYKRRDLWYKLLLLLAVSVHWFNPLAHLVAAQAEEDMEFACDYEALRGADFSLRKLYGMAILSNIQTGHGASLNTFFFGGKKHMARRLKGIVDSSAKRRGVPVFCVALALLIGSAALVGCGSPKEQKGLGFAAGASHEEIQQPRKSDSAEVDADITDPSEVFFLENLEDNQQQSADLEQKLGELYSQFEQDGGEYAHGTMKWPVPGYYMISSHYGWRYGGTDFHTGMDINGAGIYGQPVIAAADGQVKYVNTEYTAGLGYGIYMIVDHGGGVTTLYALLSDTTVAVGDTVKQGQQIAAVGSTGFSTGPHLHFEVRVNGVHTNPHPYLMEEQEGE